MFSLMFPDSLYATRKISFTFHFWHKSFISDDVKLAKFSNNSFEWKHGTFFWGGHTLTPPFLHIFRGGQDPNLHKNDAPDCACPHKRQKWLNWVGQRADGESPRPSVPTVHCPKGPDSETHRAEPRRGWGSWECSRQPLPHQLGDLQKRCKLPQPGSECMETRSSKAVPVFQVHDGLCRHCCLLLLVEDSLVIPGKMSCAYACPAVAKIPLEIPRSGSWSWSAPKSNCFLLPAYIPPKKFTEIRQQLLK